MDLDICVTTDMFAGTTLSYGYFLALRCNLLPEMYVILGPDYSGNSKFPFSWQRRVDT